DTVDHFAFARVYSSHVDDDRSDLDPEFPMPSDEGGDLRRMNNVLARQTCHIGTRSADILSLDDRGSSSFFGHRPRHQFAGCAAAQHEDVPFFCCFHLTHLLEWVLRPMRSVLGLEASS